ncbi:MAG: hypothetical protein ACRDKJ_08030 [Actinomycetota bacterium]
MSDLAHALTSATTPVGTAGEVRDLQGRPGQDELEGTEAGLLDPVDRRGDDETEAQPPGHLSSTR